MPDANSQGEDLASSDEVKVFVYEDDDQNSAREQLNEDKEGLVTETERGKESSSERSYRVNGRKEDNVDEKRGSALMDHASLTAAFAAQYQWYGNAANSPVNLKTGGLQSPTLLYNDLMGTPPPAHTGIHMPMDLKTGLVRPMFPLTPAQLPFYHDFSHVSPTWPGGPYPRGAYPPYHHLAAAAVAGRYHSSLLHPGLSQQALLSPGGAADYRAHHHAHSSGAAGSSSEHHNGNSSGEGPSASSGSAVPEKKKPHIKKPLNAFMLFMKDQRAKVVSECTLKESAAINQILGRKWHALDKGQQAKYYDLAKKERELHMKMYPGWSARDNYAIHSKKKKRRREPQNENKGGSSTGTQECSTQKKCRATFGLDEQNQWCKSCRSLEEGEDNSSEEDSTGDKHIKLEVDVPMHHHDLSAPAPGSSTSSAAHTTPPSSSDERKSAPDS